MSLLNLTITTAGQAALAQAGTIGPVVISKIAIGSGTWSVPPTPAATALVSEIKQLDPSGAETPSAGLIHITATDGTTDAYNVYEIALYTSTGVLFAIAGGTTLFLTKATGSSALFSVDLAITNVPSGSLTIGDTGFSYPPATETSLGVAEIATSAEVFAGVDDSRFVTPKKMADYYAANGSGIATGMALAETTKTSVPYAFWDRGSGDPNYVYTPTWFLTTGKTFISDTFFVPLGEVWEVEYFAPFFYNTDDGFAFSWLKNGAWVDGNPNHTAPTRYTFVPNIFKDTLAAGTHTIALKVAIFSGTGPDNISINQYDTAYRILRKYSASATSNQVLTGYALNAVDKSTKTIANATYRASTYTSTWYQAANYVVDTDTITVPVGQVWDVEYDYPIDVLGFENYATAWILNGALDSNAGPRAAVGQSTADGNFVLPNQYKVTLQAGTHTVVFKHCIFGGSGTDVAMFGMNNKVIRKYSSAATSAGVISKNANGYCILPNGLMMQWGTHPCAASPAAPTYINFPIPFTTALTFGQVSEDAIGAGGAVEVIQVDWSTVGASTKNRLAIYSNYAGTCRWFAIGY
jgi:hypothetical protein